MTETTVFEVPIQNFPYEEDEHYGKLYPYLPSVVVRNIIEKIPPNVRSAVEVDFERIPKHIFETAVTRHREMFPARHTPEEAAEIEKRLMELLFDHEKTYTGKRTEKGVME